MSDSYLEIKNVDFTIGGKIKVKNASFAIENEGDTLCILGPSGIGKTTILRTIAGLEKIDKGSIKLNGKLLSSKDKNIEPEDRNDYFEWAYENHYHGWDRGVLEWVQGFHPGRWIIMDMKRGESLEEIRDLEDYGAYTEERFIRSKDHIEDFLHNK